MIPPRLKTLLVQGLGWLVLLWLTPPALAQERPEPPPDTADAIRGLIIYQTRCATCHGPQGLGDGELAAQALSPPTAIGDPAYLATADPQMLFESIANGRLTAGMPGFGLGNNSDPLSDEQIWDVVAALSELPTLGQLIPTARITGRVLNETTGVAVTEAQVRLEAFTLDFDEALTLEAAVEADGRYQFNLERVPAQWLYRTIVTVEGLDFSSDFGRLRPSGPTLDLPVATLNSTADPAAIRIGQLDIFIEFIAEAIRINEIYRFDNTAEAIFVGESGRFDDGTLRVTLPPEAANVAFWRGVGTGLTDFAPTDAQMRPTSTNEWQWREPVGVGAGSLRLLVRYELPYQRQTTVAHALNYPANLATLILTEPNVRLQNDGVWQRTPTINGDTPNFTGYEHLPLDAGEEITIALAGRPRQIIDGQGNTISYRDERTELWWGGGILLLVAVGAAVLTQRWCTSPPPENERDHLLRALAALDDAQATQPINKRQYERRRAALVEQLRSLWGE